MNTTQPIRNKRELQKLKSFYSEVESNSRNQLLIILGLNTALRISDILGLRWKNLYDDESQTIRSHVSIQEQKTGKNTCIFLNKNIKKALLEYRKDVKKELQKGEHIDPEQYVFLGKKTSTQPITRIQAFRIIREAASQCGIKEHVSCHSLRKTFGYHAWKQGADPALLMSIYNHSSYNITKRYLCIDQDDRDQVFQHIIL